MLASNTSTTEYNSRPNSKGLYVPTTHKATMSTMPWVATTQRKES